MEIQLSLLEDVNTTIERRTREQALENMKNEKLEEACRRSGYENGELRIWAAMKVYQDANRRIEFLKDEYGNGGYSMAGGWIATFDSKGFHIVNLRGKERFEYTWAEVARKIASMVGMERYLSEEKRVKMNRIIMKNGGEIPAPIAKYSF